MGVETEEVTVHVEWVARVGGWGHRVHLSVIY